MNENDIDGVMRQAGVQYAPLEVPFPGSVLHFGDHFLMEDYRIAEIRLPSSAELDPDSPAAGKPTAFIGVYGDDLKKISPVCRFLHISMREFCDTSCPIWVYSPTIGRGFIEKIRAWKSEGYVALTFPEWIAAITDPGDAWNFLAGAKPKKKPAPRRKPRPAPADDDGDGLGHLDLF